MKIDVIICLTMCNFVKRKENTVAFISGKPGKDWYDGFKRRHPDLSIRNQRNLRRQEREWWILLYWNDISLNEILVELDISNNQQLSGSVMKPENNSKTTRSKFLLWKAPDRTTANRTNVTIMDCANAVGNVTPPIFVVKGKTSGSLHGFNNEAAPERHMLAYQEKG